jgi:hypothetical protein
MWHADATDDWAVRQLTSGSTAIDVAVDMAGTWANQQMTRVNIWLVGKGVTWPPVIWQGFFVATGHMTVPQKNRELFDEGAGGWPVGL